jgi:hypothetical protein
MVDLATTTARGGLLVSGAVELLHRVPRWFCIFFPAGFSRFRPRILPWWRARRGGPSAAYGRWRENTLSAHVSVS